MKMTLEPTVVRIGILPDPATGTLEARVWAGSLDDGNIIQALIVSVAAPACPNPEQLAQRLGSEACQSPERVFWIHDKPSHVYGG
jgi:hypothetical protein